MNKRYNEITGAELLRADIKSQQIFLERENGQTNKATLIDSDQFWGDENGSGLYYDYSTESNTGTAVPRNGWYDYSEDSRERLEPRDTKTWLKNNTFTKLDSSLTVIQGYAGCGKTIFIHSSLRSFLGKDAVKSITDVYVDYDNDCSEDGYLVSTVRKNIINLFVECMGNEDGLSIYRKFTQFLSQYPQGSSYFGNLPVLFRAEGLITKYLTELYNHRNDPDRSNFIETFQSQFLSATMLYVSRAKREYLTRGGRFDSLSNIDSTFKRLLLDIYLVLLFLLLYSINSVREKDNPIVVVFDNLDIIDNPDHIAVLIIKLQKILYKFNRIFSNINSDFNPPVFNVILAVRKITHNLIAAVMSQEVEKDGNDDMIDAKFLDISKLYSATTILKHKAKVLRDNLDSFIPSNRRDAKIDSYLQLIIDLPDKVLNELSISDLFNHNIRACANILEYAAKHSTQIGCSIELSKKFPNNCSSTIWLHNICAVLQDNEIWNSLGFDSNGSNGSQSISFPASYSRLLLTYLYNKRRDCEKHPKEAGSIEASLKDIILLLEKLPIVTFDKKDSGYSNNLEYKKNTVKYKFSQKYARAEIIRVIAHMLDRNKQTFGRYSMYEKELWRRPVYFTQNAFPLLDNNGKSCIQDELDKQLPILEAPNAPITSFCITDEGFTFIEKIVSSFEFFSVRVNGNDALPLCFITDTKQLNNVIEKVFLFINDTISEHVWLLSYYTGIDVLYLNSKNKSRRVIRAIDSYLDLPIHAKSDGDCPQLHMVRTIFDHIMALNIYRDYLITINHSNLRELNCILVWWIGKYLELYKLNFYDLLEKTKGSRNNVYLDLKDLFRLVVQAEDHLPKDDSTNRYISISRNKQPTISRQNQIEQNNISDDEKDDDLFTEEFKQEYNSLVPDVAVGNDYE